jgi:uncharacterized membrane protein
MSFVRLATLLMMLPGGVFTGAAVVVAIDRLPAWAKMSPLEYAVDYRRNVRRLDPMQPILGVLTVIGAVILAVDRSGTPRVLALAGIALMMLIIVASIVLAEPMNSAFRRLPEGEIPDGVEQIRVRWARFHRVRTVAAVAMFALMVLAVSYT